MTVPESEPFRKEDRLHSKAPEPTRDDLNRISGLVLRYYDFRVSAPGGLSRPQVLAELLTPSQRRLLLARLEDVDRILEMTASLHELATDADAEFHLISDDSQLPPPLKFS